MLKQVDGFDAQIGSLQKGLRTPAREDEEVVRHRTVPGVGSISAMAVQAFASPLESFRRGRNFVAWLGIVPCQRTTGGKPRLGRISKMAQRDLRRLLIAGAMGVARQATRRGETADPWLAMLVATVLANRMARIIWALTTKKETCRAPAAA